MAIPTFPDDQVEQIARTLAEARTHAQYTEMFQRLGFDAPDAHVGPKWLRIREAFKARQARDGVGNNVGAFIEAVMAPVNFIGASESHTTLRVSLNTILAFSGLAVTEAGKLSAVAAARTLGEAEARASELRAKLQARSVHSDVLAFCRPELLDGNHFHAVLEGTKSVAAKIRLRSGLQEDGAALVQRAFGGQQPYLAINRLANETERSEQTGFVNLVVGLFGTFRNPTAHAPRVEWAISEQDALDLLTLVSYVHRRLDVAARTHPHAATAP
jgi:uncharacterized protein (TIGR02391 family)